MDWLSSLDSHRLPLPVPVADAGGLRQPHLPMHRNLDRVIVFDAAKRATITFIQIQRVQTWQYVVVGIFSCSTWKPNPKLQRPESLLCSTT